MNQLTALFGEVFLDELFDSFEHKDVIDNDAFQAVGMKVSYGSKDKP